MVPLPESMLAACAPLASVNVCVAGTPEVKNKFVLAPSIKTPGASTHGMSFAKVTMAPLEL